jgi:hypothetical protein
MEIRATFLSRVLQASTCRSAPGIPFKADSLSHNPCSITPKTKYLIPIYGLPTKTNRVIHMSTVGTSEKYIFIHQPVVCISSDIRIHSFTSPVPFISLLYQLQ